MEQNVADMMAMLKEMQSDRVAGRQAIESMQKSLEANTVAMRDLALWKPQVDARVGDLQAGFHEIRGKVDQLFSKLDRVSEPHSPETVDPTKPATADLVAPFTKAASGASGHGSPFEHRGFGYRVDPTREPSPVTGAKIATDSFTQFAANDCSGVNWSTLLPQLDFPAFDGTCPKIWKKKCENFFEIYAVPKFWWVKLAVMYFKGSATFWLQSVDPQITEASWLEFCAAVCSRFDREQHGQLVRQFFRIKQFGSVVDYVEQFDNLVHQLLAHDSSMQPIVITNRFIDGLRDDIKAVVMLHRPVDLDTACSLAILQEEVLGETLKKEVKKHEQPVTRLSQKHPQFTGSYSAAPTYNSPSTRATHQNTGTEDRRSTDPVRFSNPSSSTDSKMAALMAFRKAKGLCYKCGLKWNPSHTCANTVPLHVVEELWQLIQDTTVESSQPTTNVDSDSGEDLCAISLAAVNGQDAPRTIRFKGKMQQFEVIILADSGSSGNSVSEMLASQIPGWVQLSSPIHVRVANGSILTCTHEIQQCSVSINGHKFLISLKILPLS